MTKYLAIDGGYADSNCNSRGMTITAGARELLLYLLKSPPPEILRRLEAKGLCEGPGSVPRVRIYLNP